MATLRGGAIVRVDDAGVRRLLKDLRDSGKNTRVPLQRIGEIHRRSIDKNFDVQGRPAKWKPLAQSTLVSRALGKVSRYRETMAFGRLSSSMSRRSAMRREFGRGMVQEFLHPKGGRILIVSGRLRRSFGKRVWDTGVVVGSPLPYAAIHQTGGTVHIPAITAKTGRSLAFPHPSIPGAIMFRKSVAAHTVSIPARPMIVVLSQDIELDKQVLTYFLAWNKLPPLGAV